ncbi:MAG: asparagine synthase C-terminal domain-containing protein [Betaproteobacteria bacterium]
MADTLQQTGAQVVNLTLSPEQLWDSMPAVLEAQDEPVHAMSAMIGYHLAALARQHGVKVILNGQGADEVLGGYGNYFRVRWIELIRQGRLRLAQQEITRYASEHLASPGPELRSLIKPSISSFVREKAPDFTSRRDELTRRASARARSWLNPDLIDHLTPLARPQPWGLRNVLADSIRRAPLPLYLRIEDRNSMAHSIEARVPFLDHRLVEFAFQLGSEWKVRGPWNKFVLREAMRGRIPESVRSRVDKMGFSTSSADWLRGPLKTRVLEVLGDPGFKNRGICRKDDVRITPCRCDDVSPIDREKPIGLESQNPAALVIADRWKYNLFYVNEAEPDCNSDGANVPEVLVQYRNCIARHLGIPLELERLNRRKPPRTDGDGTDPVWRKLETNAHAHRSRSSQRTSRRRLPSTA